jgi:hypothetical protein
MLGHIRFQIRSHFFGQETDASRIKADPVQKDAVVYGLKDTHKFRSLAELVMFQKERYSVFKLDSIFESSCQFFMGQCRVPLLIRI